MTASKPSTRSKGVQSTSPRLKRVSKRATASAKANEAREGPQPPAPSPPNSLLPKPPAGKLGVVVGLLSRPEGATIAQIGAATAWQSHSVRGAMAGALKKKHGLTIVSEPAEGGRVYRLAAA